MPAVNSKAWSAVELQTFLAILGDGVIQGELEGSIRNEKVFKEVSQRLAAHGFERTSDQCRVKVKKLKMQYRKIKDESNRSGNSGSTWKWFDAMDAIYGRRGREGGLGSAAALLESLVEPVDAVEGGGGDAFSFLVEEPSTSTSSAWTTPVIAPGPAEPETANNSPQRRRTALKRRLQPDWRTMMEKMQAAEERQLNRMEGLSERHFQILRQDTMDAQRQEAEIARKQIEHLTTFNQSFLGVLGQLVQVLGGTQNLPPPSVDEHRGHTTVSAAAERTERQRDLKESQQQIQQRIQDGEKEVKLLQQEVEAINHSADQTVKDSEKIFTHMINLIQKRSCDVKQQIRSQQQTEVSRVKDLQEELEQEITELKRRDAELKQLSLTEDHSQFLLNYPSLPPLSESTHSSSINVRPLRYFEEVTTAVSELRDKLKELLREEWTNMDVSMPEPEPKTRADFLKYACHITVDPNTAHRQLLLSEENRKAIKTEQLQSDSDHPDSFTEFLQVLSKESLTGRCYWEVEKTDYIVDVAVAYKNISRSGDESGFGFNDKSWALICYPDCSLFYHNSIKTSISARVSSRVGVYLDHRAGVLSFYNVSESMTLLHRVQTTFTQPLHAGLRFYSVGVSAEFCKLK